VYRTIGPTGREWIKPSAAGRIGATDFWYWFSVRVISQSAMLGGPWGYPNAAGLAADSG
jgi:hypothetical protein